MDVNGLQDDFFGVAMEIVENAEGEGCVCLVSPGSEGDQDPTACIHLGGPRNSMAFVKKLGKRLAGYILSGSAHLEMNDLFDVAVAEKSVELELKEGFLSRTIPLRMSFFR